jgi:hypothetical protein
MAEKTPEKEQSKQGEMRRRWRAILEDGSLASLGSEGRLVACYVQHWADFSSCEVRFSMRYVAKYLGVQSTTVRRGVSQMIKAGILAVVAASEGAGRTRYVVQDRAQGVRTHPDTLRAQGCAQGVRTPDTPCAQSAHATCAPRARYVRSPRTLCARNTFLSIGSPKRTNGESSEAAPGAGLEPAPARQSNPDTAASGAADC